MKSCWVVVSTNSLPVSSSADNFVLSVVSTKLSVVVSTKLSAELETGKLLVETTTQQDFTTHRLTSLTQ